MLNKGMVIGRLGGDPELRFTGDGTPVCNFSIATTERRKSGEEMKEFTQWHNIVAWGKLAELCKNLLQKGKLAYIEGRMNSRKWTDREGKDRRTFEIVAERMRVLSPNENKDTTDDDVPF